MKPSSKSKTAVRLLLICALVCTDPSLRDQPQQDMSTPGDATGASSHASTASHSSAITYSGIRELAFTRDFSYLQANRVREWEGLGPLNAGGRVRAVAVDYRDSNTVLCGGVSGGIFRSTDGGDSWSPVTSDSHVRLSSLAQDTRQGQGDTWYATTGELSSFGFSVTILGHGIYKSVDNGVSWALLPGVSGDGNVLQGNPFTVTHRVRVEKQTGDVYVATVGGIHRSQDGGETFSQVLADPLQQTRNLVSRRGGSSEIHITTDNTLYASVVPTLDDAGASAGADKVEIFRSTTGDKGDWTSITPNFLAPKITRVVIESAPSNSRIVYFACAFHDLNLSKSLGRDYYLYRYDYDPLAGAGTWRDLSNNVPNRSNTGFERGTYTQGSYNLELAIHPDYPDEIFLGLVSLFRSSTGFLTPYDHESEVRPITGRILHVDIHKVVFDPADSDVVYVASDGGINKSPDSRFRNPDPEFLWDRDNMEKYFTLNNDGLSVAQIYDLSLAGPDYIIAGTQDQGAWVGRKGEAGWSAYDNGDVGRVSSSRDGRFTITSVQRSVVNAVFRNIDPTFKSRSGTNSSFSRGLKGGYKALFQFDPTRIYRFFVVASSEMFVVDDADAFISDPLANPQRRLAKFPRGVNPFYGAMDITSYPQPHIYSFTYAWNEEYLGTLVQIRPRFVVISDLDSNDPGTRIGDSDVFPEAESSDVFANVYDGRKILASFRIYNSETKIVYSGDAGVSWENVTGNLGSKGFDNPGPQVNALAIVGDNFLFLAGTTSGLFASHGLDGENTIWEKEASGTLKNHLVTDMEVDQVSRVTVGTFGGGVYQANYEIDPPPVYFSQTPGYQIMGTGTSKVIDLADFIEGEVNSIEVSSTKASLLGAAVSGMNLTLTAGGEIGVGSVTVVVHAMQQGMGTVETFGVRVHQDGVVAEAEVSYRIEVGSSTFSFGKVVVRNVGEHAFSLLGLHLSKKMQMSETNFPYTIAVGGEVELGFEYTPDGGIPATPRVVFEISKAPFSLELDLDLPMGRYGGPLSSGEVGGEASIGVEDDGNALACDSFSVYPIPVGETLHVDCGAGGEALMRIHDLTGSLLHVVSSQGQSLIDVGFLAAGTYILTVEISGEIPRAVRFVRR